MKPPGHKDENRRRSPRFKAQLKARLLFTVVLSGEPAAGGASGKLQLVGHTKDISEIGLALIVPIAEIDERFLVGEQSKMQIELFLPQGALQITARPVRYKLLDKDSSENVFSEGYLIGAEITKVSDSKLFTEYLSGLENE